VFKPHKNNKIQYYAQAVCRLLIPRMVFQRQLKQKLSRIRRYDITYINDRVNYYNKLSAVKSPGNSARALKEYTLPEKLRVYFFDSQEHFRYFNGDLRANLLPGDIVHVPAEPTFLKSRPVTGNNENSVLLKLNKIRHFLFVRDPNSFLQKKNILIGRGVVKVPHRISFYEKYFNHPLCDLGQINAGMNQHWIKPKLSLASHLEYKFILCLEGYDVATNLKWVMSSNSLAVMPEPAYESWFMEGRLIPNYHYIKIASDYSDLESQLTYYIEHTDEALAILRNAHAWIEQFRDNKREELISLLVLEKYFRLTDQKL
jgi:hypothetical protein